MSNEEVLTGIKENNVFGNNPEEKENCYEKKRKIIDCSCILNEDIERD